MIDHHDENGRWSPPPFTGRVYADFTGIHAREDAQRSFMMGTVETAAPDVVVLHRPDGGLDFIHNRVHIGGTFAPESEGPIPVIAENGPEAIVLKGAYPDGNPKTLMGAKKPDLTVVPPVGILHLATAMMNGAEKYGPFNWRDKGISTRPYIAAAMRHLMSYLDGEDFSADTVEAGLPVHHLGHVMACCAILLDAESVGQLNDNRPGVAGKTGELIEGYATTKRLSTKPTA